MTKCILLIFLMVVGCSSGAASTYNGNLIREARDLTVIIISPSGMGAGVIVKSKDKVYIWTASHVVNPIWLGISPQTNDKIIIKVLKVYGYENGKTTYYTSYANVVAIGEKGKDEDLALIEISSKQEKYTTSAIFSKIDKPDLGTEVIHIGNFTGQEYPLTASSGIISNRTGVNNHMSLDMASTQIQEGSSGGGMFSKDGRCLGIVVQKVSQQGFAPALYVPVRRMKEFAKKYKVEYALPIGE